VNITGLPNVLDQESLRSVVYFLLPLKLSDFRFKGGRARCSHDSRRYSFQDTAASNRFNIP
jgi:hypothetical protein